MENGTFNNVSVSFKFLKFSPKKGIVSKSLLHTRKNERRTFLVSRVYWAHSGPLSFILSFFSSYSPPPPPPFFFFFPLHDRKFTQRLGWITVRIRARCSSFELAIAQMFFRAPEGEACSLHRRLKLGELTLRWYATLDLTAKKEG